MLPMNYSRVSDRSLLKVHGAIREAVDHDRNSAPGAPQHGTSHYSDWRDQAEAVEDELLKRAVPFEPIRW